MKKQIIIFVVGLVAGSGLVFGLMNRDSSDRKYSGDKLIRQSNSGFQFIKPLLATEFTSKDEGVNFYPYEKQIEKEVGEIIDKSKKQVGFYFNDLSNLSWVGINESDKFVPASTIKVPMLIAYYKIQETRERNLFETKVKYEGPDFNVQRNLLTDNGIRTGEEYTIGEMLKRMIIYSDNNALEFLYNFRQDALKNIFEDLQAPFPKTREDIANKGFLSPQEWSKFIIVLYNASYLTRADSEASLELLSNTEFRDGLVAGVPEYITVAHKFGERRQNIGTPQETAEMHDCGIVYYEPRPYLICVMTKGKDLNKQTQVIKEISAKVYEVISTQQLSIKSY